MPDSHHQHRSTFQIHHNSIPNTTINTTATTANTTTNTITSPSSTTTTTTSSPPSPYYKLSSHSSSKYYETKLQHVHQAHGVTSQSCLPTSATTTYHSPPHQNLPHQQQQHMYFSNQQQCPSCLSSISPKREEIRLPPIQYLLSQPNSMKANPTTITSIHNPSPPLDIHVDQVYQLFNTSNNNNTSACTKTSSIATKSVINNMHECAQPVPFQNHQPLSSHAPNATRPSLKADNMHVVLNGTSNLHHVHVDVVNACSSSHMSINSKNDNNKNSTVTCVVNGKSPALTCQPPTTYVLSHESASAIDMGSDSEPQHHDTVVGSMSKERKDQGYLSTSSFEGDENTAFNPERTKLACSVCRFAKKKCDGKDPCGRCSRLGKECTFSNTGKTRGRPKKQSIELTGKNTNSPNQLYFHDNSFQEHQQQQPRSKKKKSSNE